jgi:hypothetical protein
VDTVVLTEMGHLIRVTGNLNQSVNGVINWVIQQNIAQKCLLLISLQIVQLLLTAKIING